LRLAKSSFSSDLAIFAELDYIAGTTDAKAYERDVFLQFLRNKGWNIDLLAEISDDTATDDLVEPISDSASHTVARPLSHIVFVSSNSESDAATDAKAPGPAQDMMSYVKPDDEDDESQKKRSDYVGRGNVRAVRSARKAAGLIDGFARSDPLLIAFSDFLQLSGAAT